MKLKMNTKPQAGYTLFSPNSDEHTAPQQMAFWRS